MTACVWLIPLQHKARYLRALHPQPLLQWVKAKQRFTLVLERALSACCFASQGYISISSPLSISVTFSCQHSVQSLCSTVLLTRPVFCSPPPQKLPKQLRRQAKHQNTGRGQFFSIHSHHHTFKKAQKR